jgi:hypothetical protein
MVWFWGALEAMTMRQQYGYPWVPSALMPPVQMAPGLPPLAGAAPYDPEHPPAGAILVSTNIADYPPYNPPAPLPVPPAPPVSLVGVEEGLGSGIFQAFVAAFDELKDGQEYDADPRGAFIFHVSHSLFAPNGRVGWFTRK